MSHERIRSPRVRLQMTTSLLLTVFWSGVALALDPSKSITQYIHDLWDTGNGLPKNNVRAIIQTRTGYLWLGTSGGLARFDGLRFTVFDTQEMKNNYIQALFEDREGSLWIGTKGGGLNRWKDGKLTAYTTREGLSSNQVRTLCGDREGNLWIGTNGGGLNRWRDGEFTVYTTAEGLSNNKVSSLCEDRESSLWIGTDGGGLNHWKDGKFTVYTTAEGLSSNKVNSLCEDREGSLWIGTDGGGLNRWKDGRFTTYTTREGLSSDYVVSLYEDRAGSLWIGTYGGGLNRWRDGKLTHYTSHEGLSSDIVNPIYEDWEGSLWIGTDGGGLNRLKDGKCTTYTTQEGLSSDRVTVLLENREGSLWIGTDGGGLNRLNERKWTTYTTREGLSSNHVVSLHEDREGSLWVGTDGGGLHRWKDGKWTVYAKQQALSKLRVAAIHKDQKGVLWIGTNAGLYLLKSGKLTRYTSKEGFLHHSVTSLHEDKGGSLWIGTEEGGLKHLKSGKLTTLQEGFPDGVTSISEDRQGSLWVGTWSGLKRLKDGILTSYTTREGLFDNVVLQILQDGKGSLWMGTNNGIFRVSQKDLNDFAEGKIRSITSVAYGKADGLKTCQCSFGNQPGAWKTRDGRLWFATSKGAVMIDLEQAKTNEFPPPVIIEQILIDKKIVDPHQTAQLSPGHGELEFQNTGLSFLAPERVNFRYKLEGFDQEWIEAGTRRVAYYTNIRPGSYRFRVRACNNDGVWNETGAAFSFYLAPHFYQTYWFYSLCVLAAVLLGAGGYRLRVQQMKKREEELVCLVGERTAELQREITRRKLAEEELQTLCNEQERRVEERTAELRQLSGRLLHLQDGERRHIARELHDSTAQSLVTLVMNLALVDRAGGALDSKVRQALSESRALAKQCSKEIRTLSYLLHPSMLDQAGLANFLPWYAEGFTQRSGIRVGLDIPPKLGRLPRDMEMTLFRIVQESFTNIHRHSQSETAGIRILLEANEITLEVSDEGRGIPSEILKKFNSKDETGAGLGVGMAGMRERLRQLGGRLEIRSSSQGTTIKAILPLSGDNHVDGSHSDGR